MQWFLLFLLLAICVSYAEAQIDKWPCPSVKVIRPNGVSKPGDIVIFEARIEPVPQHIKYRWEVTDGQVEEGNGTSKIRVRVGKDDPYIVIAEVFVDGLTKGCNPMGVALIPINGQLIEGQPIDDFSGLKPNDVRGRLDSFFQELINNPSNRGFIVLYVKGGEKIGIANARLQLILKHTRPREFDVRRFDIAFAPSHESKWIFWRVPPGARIPDCDRCFIVKGINIK